MALMLASVGPNVACIRNRANSGSDGPGAVDVDVVDDVGIVEVVVTEPLP